MGKKNAICPAERKPQDFVYLGVVKTTGGHDSIDAFPVWRCTSCNIVVIDPK